MTQARKRWRWSWVMIALGLLLGGAGSTLGQGGGQRPAQSAELAEAARLAKQVEQLYDAGKYAAAIPLAERALAIREKALSPDHLDVAHSLNGLADLYKAQADHARAEPLYLRALAIRERALGPAHPDVATTLNNLAGLYKAKSNYAQAEQLFRRALAMREKALGPNHPDVATSLNDFGELYKEQGDYTRAEQFYQRALAIREQALGPAHRRVAESLNNLGLLYHTRGDYARAEQLYRRALAVKEKALGPDHPALASTLNNLAALYYTRGDYAKAEPLFQRTLAIDERALGPNHPDLAYDLNNLAALYAAQGDYIRATPLFQRALAISEKSFGAEHPDVAYALDNLAALYQKKGDYARAEPLYQRGLAIREKKFGPAHPDVAASLHSLALLYEAKSDYARAEPLYQRSLAIREQAFGPGHPNVASSLINLAELYKAQGDYARAEPLYLRAIAVYEKALGAEHHTVGISLNNLADLYRVKGDYAQAQQSLERALAIFERALGPNHPDVASALVSLAVLSEAKGDYARAEPLYQRALAIFERALGPVHPDVATALDNLAGLYTRKRDYARAAPLYQRAIAIRDKTLGPAHPRLAAALNGFGLMYWEQGDYAPSAPLLQRALAIREKALGPDHPDVAESLNNLAALYQVQGDYTRAEAFFQRAIAVNEKTLGPDHPSVAQALNNFAVLYSAAGDRPRALQFLTRGNEVRERNLALILAAGSERQKLLYLVTLSGETDVTVSLHVRSAPADRQALELALTTILRRKGRALDAMTDQIALLRRRLDPQDRALLDQLSTTQAQLSALVLNGPGKSPPAEHRAAVARLEAEGERLQDAIGRRSAEFKAQAQPVTLTQVQQAIPADAALVEFFSYRPYDPRWKKRAEQFGRLRYVAYVLRRAGEPLFVELGEAATIEAEVARLRAALANPRSTDVKQAARALDERVLRPVRQLLGDTRHIFLSPDGALNLVPFAAFVDEQGRYLVESYTFTYLTSGRDLLRLQLSGESKQPPLVLADPLFDIQQTASNPPARGAAKASGQRSAEMEQIKFSALPGTAGEAKALGAILNVAPLTQARATEATLKQSSAPRILHVATHGFFLPDQPQEMLHNTRGLALGDEAARQAAARIENPLLRSGLALAGANTRQSGGGEDGILTALEVATLNLWGTKLVVLSACETGIGDIKTGEGVYGLRRALVLAGAESQVVSLWKVSDAATRDLMVEYYRRLQAGEGRTAALRQVQLVMIKSKPPGAAGGAQRGLSGNVTRQAEDRSHPFYWASFIQSGAWQSMAGGRVK